MHELEGVRGVQVLPEDLRISAVTNPSLASQQLLAQGALQNPAVVWSAIPTLGAPCHTTHR